MKDRSILIVEDEHTLRRLLEYRLSRLYRVRTAANGLEALAAVAEERPALIVSDIIMPQMDGYALQEALQKQSDTSVIPFIFLTAKTDASSRARGRRTGVDDYITKPFDLEHLLSRIARLLERQQVYQTQLDAFTAQDFSQKLMPKRMPAVPDYHSFFFNLPREQGGGDFFDWNEAAPGTYFFTLGDVMGKGLQAKFYAFSFLAYVRGTLHTHMRTTHSPAGLMSRVNQILTQDELMGETFASLLLARWDAYLNRITVCNAGHCRPLLVGPDGSQLVADSDLVLGLSPDATFTDTTIELGPQQAFFAYTDGLIEQRLATGEMVGEHGLAEAVQHVREAPDPLEALTKDLLARSAEPEFADDVLGFWLKRVR
ncbi:MAG: fused response regulator/phosphatase [Rhodothermales bacterium]|nr:fused response regulator/phosphatase [Rhodothermales bacterium]MCA0268622.1 fused response regulator/phosphatase [Bacteroidota bacterium]